VSSPNNTETGADILLSVTFVFFVVDVGTRWSVVSLRLGTYSAHSQD
jgi:hypothetical protein